MARHPARGRTPSATWSTMAHRSHPHGDGRIGGSTLLGVGTGSMVVLANLPDRERDSVLHQNRAEIAASGRMMPTGHVLSQTRQKGYSCQPDATMVGAGAICQAAPGPGP